ncbi:LemA family protein [Georgenia subflava]|uniref:LemA family protein n=1 Tax=Georgenia subflava TaxID=1622177 RepID=A0A6N7EL34_9MICO|nr:LemA family protein [Georgenia subflava]MPV36836.1 LemA family protein [Georgenia subflava]
MDALGVVLIIIGVVVVIVLIWAIATYNGLVRLRNLVQEAWRQIDVELHRRYDLIPNLIETVKGYAAHERAVFDEVTEARAAAATPGTTPAQQAQQENQLTAALGRLFAVAEAYPELRAAEAFTRLQAELTNTEDRIAAGRRFYNANVRQLNTKVETFPPNIVASLFSFRRAEYFEANDPAVRTAPAVSFADREGDVGIYRGTERTAPARADASPSFGGQRGGYDPARDGGRPTEGVVPPDEQGAQR